MTEDDLVISILTGGRPDLLAETLASVRESSPDLLERSAVIVLHNGGDAATRWVIEDHADLFDKRLVTARVEPIGKSVSTLSRWALETRRRYWLHLEDDWKAHPVDGWLEQARDLLSQGASQVRLRRADEPVLPRHMVTGESLYWTTIAGHRWTASAHYTLNPSLVWLDNAPDAWPASGERAAQKRWHRAGRTVVAQHVPGVWSHIGEDRSLRKETGCEM